MVFGGLARQSVFSHGGPVLFLALCAAAATDNVELILAQIGAP